MDLDFSASTDPAKRFDAHVAVQSYSRGYGAPTPTGLVGPYLIDGEHPRDPRKAPDVAPCGVDAASYPFERCLYALDLATTSTQRQREFLSGRERAVSGKHAEEARELLLVCIYE